ncbi:MAG: hypothetical protein DMF89_19015 [Acidobacteria bacterium]|nr:MAG: hypothetical protein DMF89_19015 [Acidobacteriota bacterium]
MNPRLLPASVLLFSSVLLSSVLTVVRAQQGGCAPDGNVKFICGVVSPEDLVAVPRSEWVVASGFSGGAVHLVNTRDYTTTEVFPVATPRERFDKKMYAACPGPIDPGEKDKFSAHGLAVREGSNNVHTVYVVHHGFRESIEVFEVDTRAKPPTFTWVGCAIAPPTASFNSVSPVPGGGFVATNPNRRGPGASQGGTNTGEVFEWSASEGFKVVPGSESQGPNGIEVSRDGKWLYVNLWPASQVMRLSRGQTPMKKDVIDLPFHPDNIRWQPDGSLFAAGHGGPNNQRVIECLRKVCSDATSNVARIDPQTLKMQHIVKYPSNEKFYSSTVALQVGKEIWLGTITQDRIARYPAP